MSDIPRSGEQGAGDGSQSWPPPYPPPPSPPPPPYPGDRSPGPPPSWTGENAPPPPAGSYYGGYGPSQSLGMPLLAGWWRRAGGLIIDALIVGAVVFLISLAITRKTTTIGYAVSIAVQLVYQIVLIGRQGQTIGMRALGIVLQDTSTGRSQIGYQKSALRAITAFVIALPAQFVAPLILLPLVSFLWPLWDRQNQTWYDKVAGTIPLRTR